MRATCGRRCDAEMSNREGANKNCISSFLAKGEGNTFRRLCPFPQYLSFKDC